MTVEDIFNADDKLTQSSQRCVMKSKDERMRIMLPQITSLFNTISAFNGFGELELCNYEHIIEIVEKWINYLAFHGIVINVPSVPLYSSNLCNEYANTSVLTTIITQRGKRKKHMAKVIKKSGSKSITVAYEYIEIHPKYGKHMRRTKKVMVHDEKEEANIGDYVLIMECRPLSKTKHFRLVEVLMRALSWDGYIDTECDECNVAELVMLG